MPIINYVREHTRFMEYATDEHLTASERLLWYALMHIMNQRAQGKVWPDEFIRISNDRLLSFCPMKYDTIAAARNSLKQRGLIEFTKGEKNKLSPSYRMIYFYPEYIAPDTETDEDNPKSNPKKTEYIGGNIGGNNGGNSGGNMGGNTGDFILNYNKRIDINHEYMDEEEEQQQDSYARAREEAEMAWLTNFGKKPTPATLDRLARASASIYHFGSGVLSCAIKSTAARGAESPFSYATTLLHDWYCNGVQTEEDANEYAYIFDVCNGKLIPHVMPEEGNELLKRFQEKRKERKCV